MLAVIRISDQRESLVSEKFIEHLHRNMASYGTSHNGIEVGWGSGSGNRDLN
jgi:hypothetical protein